METSSQKITSAVSSKTVKEQKQNNPEHDLKSKSDIELEEVLERHKSILCKSHLLAKLPDKGKKLTEKVQWIENELVRRAKASASVDEVVTSLSSVQLRDASEWSGGATETHTTVASDSKTEDPLYDLIQTFKSSKSRNFDPYVEALCSKYGSQHVPDSGRKKFVPCKSTESTKKVLKDSIKPAEPSIQQLPMKDSLFLQKQATTADLSAGGPSSLLSKWRQMATTIDSDTDEEAEAKLDEEPLELEDNR